MAAPPTLRAIHATAIEVPMARPVGTSAQALRTAPLLLIDLETEEGITGHAYMFCYTRMAPGLIAAVLADHQPDTARLAIQRNHPAGTALSA